MLKKFTYLVTVLLVSLSMLAFTAPTAAFTKRALKGTIVAIDTTTRSLTVAPLHGKSVKIKVAKTTSITHKGKHGGFSNLHVGDKVNLNYDDKNKQASNIDDSHSQYEIHGTVEMVNTTTGTIRIASEQGGNSVTLNINASTVIKRNGGAGTLADLLAGDKVEAKYNSASMLASAIKTEVEDSEFNGTIAALNATAKTVTITPDLGGANVVLRVVESTVFIDNHVVIAFSNLQVGDQVEAAHDSVSMIASKIEVEDSD